MKTDPQQVVEAQQLPVCAQLGELRERLVERDEVILQAAPGAGKTTLVPLAMLGEPWLGPRRVLVLEPRRLAARSAAERMAELLAEPTGERVGYRMRGATRVSAATRIEVVTEGVFSRMLGDDPSLSGIGLVVFDEFHERNLESDLGLAMAWYGRELLRDTGPPLKFLLMSATLDTAALATLLDTAPVVECAGREYPVELCYQGPRRPGEDPLPRLLAAIDRALQETAGNLLVFLPGQAEIHSLARALPAREGVMVAPLFGGLDLPAQRRAIECPPEGLRKIVLSTNVAETSLTIEGISAVIDGGLVREPRHHAGSGLSRLVTRPVSRASSIQRAGRAGRTGPGRCYRLWSEEQQGRLEAVATPEILQAELSTIALQLLSFGVSDPGELRWLDMPPSGAWSQAQQLLHRLGAAVAGATGDWQISADGQLMAALPLPVRLAHLLLAGNAAGHLDLASELAALLAERDPLDGQGSDIQVRLECLAGAGSRGGRIGDWRSRIRAESRRYHKLCRRELKSGPGGESLPAALAAGYLVACAWPDRVAKRVAADRYQLASGRQVKLPRNDPLAAQEWLAIAETGGTDGDRVLRAATLDPGLFETLLSQRVRSTDVVAWDRRTDRLRAERRQLVGVLVLNTAPLEELTEERRVMAVVAELRERGLELLPWTPALRQWQARVELLRRLEAAGGTADDWPEVSDAALSARAEEWLAPFLAGVSSAGDFRRVDLTTALTSLLSWQQARALDELLPVSFRVPSGASKAIDYLAEPPVLAVKLQEMFGCEESPAVAHGRVPLVLHLLSPAGRPLQVTSDLATFWRSGYLEVRKEMRGRYPKHPWPEDPLRALPTAATRRR